ncbi:hypothetical protein BH10ACI2_BH10ACI2_24540 [soil metagenome]
MTFDFEYELTGSGWAAAVISTEDRRFQMTASYLSDALGDLLQALIDLMEGKHKVSFTFMDEPGEHRVSITKIDVRKVLMEIDWFDDWLSWGMDDEKKGKRVLDLELELPELTNKVKNSLDQIIKKYGLSGYKAKWVEHDFPVHNYEKLKLYIRNVGH